MTFPSPLVVILSNSPQPISVMQLTLLPLGRLKQQYKSQSTLTYHQPTCHSPDSVQTPQENWYEGSGEEETAPSVTKA